MDTTVTTLTLQMLMQYEKLSRLFIAMYPPTSTYRFNMATRVAGWQEPLSERLFMAQAIRGASRRRALH